VKVRATLERRHTALLVLLLAAITLAVTFSTIALLYRTAVAEERALLTDMARSQARFVEVVAGHEMATNRDPSSAVAAALEQVLDAHAKFDSVGRTGEVVLARRDGDRIVFVATHAGATASEVPAEIPFDAKLAEPMRRALRGDSGTVIGLDYRGHTVLAAYEPVRVPNLGVVTKIDLSEVQAPFLRAGVIALGTSLGAILLGAWAFTRLTRPLIRRMHETQQRYEDVVETMGEGLAFQDAEGRLTYVNDRLCEMMGFRKRDILGRRIDEFFHESQRDAYRRRMELRGEGGAQSYEVALKRRDGSPLHVLMAPRVLRDAAGNSAGSFVVVAEITDLKRVEEQLRREKELAQSYFDTAGVILVVLDAAGRIELINRRGVEVLGYTSADELVGRDWFATCIPSAQRDEVGRVFRRTMAGDVAPVDRFENAVLRWDGQTRVVLWSNALLYDSDGRVRGTLSSGEDVTELRTQTARLAHVNAVLRAIRNVNQLITRETDRDRLLEEGCRELVATEGVRRAWAVELDSSGRPLRAAEAGIGDSFAALRASLLRGELPTCCRRALSAGGSVVLLEPSTECGGCRVAIAYEDAAAIAVPLRREERTHGLLIVTIPRAWAADDEELSLFREVASDLAFALHDLDAAEAQARAEAALESSERRYRSLFENAVLGIYQTTPDGRILAANPALVRMLGFGSFEELAARNLEQEGYEPKYSRAEFKERLEREGAILGSEAGWTRADGATVYVRENAVAVRDAEGRVLYYEGTVEDVSARHEAEEAKARLEAQLRQAQKLESIGTLASGIAHEINNPLTGIINYAELIRERVADDGLRGFAAGIVEEGNRVAKTVRGILSFARQEKETHSPARVRDVVDGALSLIGAVLRKDQIEVAVDVPADLPRIRCRTEQMRQVILNLLTNARDALNTRFPGHDDQKRIEIRGTGVTRYGRRWVRLTVEDYGIGIPHGVEERIFDPFFTTKSRDQGTGLGLAISYGIVRDHGGTLSVESEESAFTRFTVEWPALEENMPGEGGR